MSDNTGIPEASVETTSVFRADLLKEMETGAQAESSPAGVEGLPSGSALLVVKRGPNAGSRFLLDQDTTASGRHPDSDIFLDDVTVSRKHAEFVRTPSGFTLRDTGSLNGTYVGRQLIDSIELQNGADVQIGKFRMIFQQRPRSS